LVKVLGYTPGCKERTMRVLVSLPLAVALAGAAGAQARVYDVAWGDDRTPGADGKLPQVGSTVDLSIPSWTNTNGAPELGAVWTAPDFDPAEPAFYDARVIEIPTPRWTAYDALKFNLELPDHIPLTSQQSAYSSPIWYTPN
jgi:hypothetical protein